MLRTHADVRNVSGNSSATRQQCLWQLQPSLHWYSYAFHIMSISAPVSRGIMPTVSAQTIFGLETGLSMPAGISDNQLRLDAHALAGLYSCKIRSFNGYIQSLNPDLM